MNKYEDCYCLFLDILGFKSLIESIEKETDKSDAIFNKTIAALKTISRGVGYNEKIVIKGKTTDSSRKVTQFSDSVVISYQKGELDGSGLFSIIADVHMLQLELIRSQIFLRGAITRGDLYHDQSFVFGPAFIEAVELEKLANYPRVIISQEIVSEAKIHIGNRNEERTISSMLSKDFDGLYYIDYFNVCHADFYEDTGALAMYLESLRNAVKSLSSARAPSIKVKHSWLRTKFNELANTLRASDYCEYNNKTIPDSERDLFKIIKPF